MKRIDPHTLASLIEETSNGKTATTAEIAPQAGNNNGQKTPPNPFCVESWLRARQDPKFGYNHEEDFNTATLAIDEVEYQFAQIFKLAMNSLIIDISKDSYKNIQELERLGGGVPFL